MKSHIEVIDNSRSILSTITKEFNRKLTKTEKHGWMQHAYNLVSQSKETVDYITSILEHGTKEEYNKECDKMEEVDDYGNTGWVQSYVKELPHMKIVLCYYCQTNKFLIQFRYNSDITNKAIIELMTSGFDYDTLYNSMTTRRIQTGSENK